MNNFTNKWNKIDSQNLKDKFENVIKPTKPLRPIIESAVKQIRIQINKINLVYDKLISRSLKLFNNVVISIQKHDSQHAIMFANELSEVKKMNKIIEKSKLALEQIAIRLETIRDFGDIASNLGPAIPVIKNIKNGLINIIPEAENGIKEINDLLQEVLINAGQNWEGHINFEINNKDAEKILDEASIIAEERLKNQFPEIPDFLYQKMEKKILEPL